MVAFANPSRIPPHGSSFAGRRDGGCTLYLHSLLELLIRLKQGSQVAHSGDQGWGVRETGEGECDQRGDDSEVSVGCLGLETGAEESGVCG